MIQEQQAETMEPKTLEALKDSIAHWEDVVKNPETAKVGSGNCALCKLFGKHTCGGCPVSEKTGNDCCDETPFRSFLINRTAENAQAELDFLKSLLP